MALISDWQRELRSLLSRQTRAVKADPMGPAMLAFLGLAAGYGALHALGPGHGKVFACSYFATRRARIRQAVITSAGMAALHVFSAVLLVGVGYLLAGTFGTAELQARSIFLQRLSYGALAVLGLILACKVLWDMIASKDEDVCAEADGKSMAGLVLAVGLVPCPGAAIIFLFCLNLGLIEAGAVAMIAVALGMAATTTAASLAAMASRQGVFILLARHSFWFKFFHRVLSLGGAVTICILGVLLYGSVTG